MHEEYEPVPVSPAAKVAIGMAVALFIAVVAQVSGFVNVSSVFGGDDLVGVDDPSSSTVPGTLAFEDDPAGGQGTGGSDPIDGGETTGGSDDGSGSTRPTIVETIELNPIVTVNPTTTTTPSSTTAVGAQTSTTTDGPVDDEADPDDTIPPQFDENGDPIPVPDDEQSTENEPVYRTYNDYDGGSS